MLLGEQGDQTPTLNFPIPVVTNFKYLRVSIFPSSDLIAINNYNKVLKDIEEDLTNWDKFPTSFQSKLSVIRMNVLPRVNFVSSMIPLTPPNNYWKKLHSTKKLFLWNKKKTRIKTSTLQRHKSAGGVNLPNFEWYSWCSVLRPLAVWLNPNSEVSWRPIEENLTHPCSLHNLIYSNISYKLVERDFGPIISYLFTVWFKVQQFAKIHTNFFHQSPIFCNFRLLIDENPISFPQWSNKGVNTLQDIIGKQGLLEFRELQRTFDLPGTSFFKSTVMCCNACPRCSVGL